VDVVPRIEIHHMVSPSPFNPLGVKGAAESGTIGAPAAIVSAIEDALRPFEVRVTDLPVTPARLHALIQKAASRRTFGGLAASAATTLATDSAEKNCSDTV
jgi:carbon-monoxide dehydrogenase large subunit